jgi:hypothetical protein
VTKAEKDYLLRLSTHESASVIDEGRFRDWQKTAVRPAARHPIVVEMPRNKPIPFLDCRLDPADCSASSKQDFASAIKPAEAQIRAVANTQRVK